MKIMNKVNIHGQESLERAVSVDTLPLQRQYENPNSELRNEGTKAYNSISSRGYTGRVLKNLSYVAIASLLTSCSQIHLGRGLHNTLSHPWFVPTPVVQPAVVYTPAPDSTVEQQPQQQTQSPAQEQDNLFFFILKVRR